MYDELVRCKCGSQPRFFGEARMQSIICDGCKAYVSVVQETGKTVNIKQAWNKGVRGWIDDLNAQHANEDQK